MPTVEITKGVYWVGALHPDLRVFDIIMETPEGTSYNAFLVRGEEKTALIDTVKVRFFQDYVKKLEEILPLASIDYLVVNHVEPDHSGSVEQLLDLVPGLTVVGSATALAFLREITNRKFNGRPVSDGEQLELGGRTLTFLNLPFLHWPDSIYTYLEQDRILFTCDSFGSHVPDERLFADLIDRDLTAAYKDYFDAIMGPFKPYVRAALERIEGLPVDIICPGHGPVLRQDLERYLQMYREWSQEPAREPGARPKVVVPYVAAYGYTASIAQSVVEGLTTVIDAEVVSMDLIETPVSEVLQELQTADALLVGSPTLNGDAPPPVWNLLTQLSPIVHSRLLASAFGAYGWSGEAVPNITARLASLRMQVVPGLRINFKPSDADLEKAFAFGMEFARALQAKLQPASKRRWRCLVCGHIAVGEEPPAHCPACGVGRENFVEEMPEEEFRLDADKTFVVIGSGIAALSAAEAIRSRNQVGRIVMVTEEEVLPYYRPMLSDLLGEDLPDDRLFIHDQPWYDERRIEVRRGVRVTAIDVKARKVSLDDGSELHYDKLIYAAGARSIRPPFPGVDLGGVFTLRSLADGRALKRELREGARGVVIGGGVLGLEAAWEMVQRGLQVTVVEGLDRIMPRQLDESSSRRVEALMRERGVQLFLGARVQELVGSGRVEGVRLVDGTFIPADLVLLSTGTRPNVEVAEAAGLKVARGVVVDAKMRTSDPDVYAAGDVAQFGEQVVGLWPVALEMGRIAGAAAAGDWIEYRPPLLSTMLAAFDKEIFSVGEVNLPPHECRVVEVQDPPADFYKKSFIKNGVLVGEIIIAPSVDTTRSLRGIGRDESGEKRYTRWKCRVCGYIHEGPEPPDECPVCGAPKNMFDPLD